MFLGFIRDITQRRRNEEILRENEEQFKVARDIQQRLFPKSAPNLSGFDIAGISIPSDAAGGDYYDYLPMLDQNLGLVVGDVTGHGIGPALLMAETRAYLRIVAGNQTDLGKVLTSTNKVLAADVGKERYITLLLAALNPHTRTLMYANAGHPAGFIFDGSGEVKSRLTRNGPPLGMKPSTIYRTAEEVQLEKGDLLLLLTDGIEETLSSDDKFFGIERILKIVRQNQHLPAITIIENLFAAHREFAGNASQVDDLTVLLIKVED
jgi:phosphoserine phosphatase RsbU/P